MLGFATIDISAGDDTLTVWLTSAEGAHAGHTNAVIFKLGDDTAPRRALGMICDRYVVLTGRTPVSTRSSLAGVLSLPIWRCSPRKPPLPRPPSGPRSRSTALSEVRQV